MSIDTIVSMECWNSLKVHGAVWGYPGDPRAPHVELRSGKHSDGFIDTLQYLSPIRFLSSAAGILADRIGLSPGIRGKVDWVFGSPMAGIPFATVVGQMIGAGSIGFTEKVDDKNLFCRFDLPSGSRVLEIEEMTTSGATPQRAIDAILKKNPTAEVLGVVGAFLIRCDRNPLDLPGRTLVPVISLPELGVVFNEWDVSECPLCREGSRPIANCKRVWRDLLETMNDPARPITVS